MKPEKKKPENHDLFHQPAKPKRGTPARARRTDPPTSHDAAADVDTTRLEARVLAALRERGPMTSEEVANVTGIDKWSVSPRFRPLAEKGLVRDTLTRRRSSKGKGQIVWAARRLE